MKSLLLNVVEHKYIIHYKKKSKLQKSSFMYVTYCKMCSLSSIITENVLDVCKLCPLALTHLIFVVKSDQMDPT
ncbi:hypothetical protein Hanom_Chr17g01528101 [Helianthus anomalus]